MARARSSSSSTSEKSSEESSDHDQKKKKRKVSPVAQKKAKKRGSSSSNSSSSAPKRSSSSDSQQSSESSSVKRSKKKSGQVKGKPARKKKTATSRSSSSSSVRRPVKRKALNALTGKPLKSNFSKVKSSKNKSSKGKNTKSKGKRISISSERENEPGNEAKDLTMDDSEVEKKPEEVPMTVPELMQFSIKAKQEWEQKELRGGLGLEADFYSAAISERYGPDDRFQTKAQIGKGAFSTVYRCTNTMDGRDYAVKIISSQAMKRQVAEWEFQMYRLCAEEARKLDPEGSRYLMGMGKPEKFTIGNNAHLALVFPLQKCDMRRGMQKYAVAKGKGLLLRAVQLYGRQLFLALRALKTANVVHCDLKPENLLLTPDKSSIVVCDFGNAVTVAEQVCIEDMQPQPYRAPEVILGRKYDTQIDVWSAGTVLYEMATGQTLFPGKSNNEVLRQMLDACGAFPLEFVTSGEFVQKHFDTVGDFILGGAETPEVTAVPMVHWEMPKTPVKQMFGDAVKDTPKGKDAARHMEKVRGLGDFFELCLMPDPVKRITPEDALQVPILNL